MAYMTYVNFAARFLKNLHTMPGKNGRYDIPDYDNLEDEAFPPLPPPHSPGLGGQEDGDPFGSCE